MKIALSSVTKAYGSNRVLDAVNFESEFDHTLALIGPSGGGKSTLLRFLAGLDIPDSGSLFVNGAELPQDEGALRRYRRRAGIVFQAYNLFPHLSALENLLLHLTKVHHLGRPAALERADAVLRRFQLQDHTHKQPALLSGGQRQRIGIARALAVEPRFIVCDEPVSALDVSVQAQIVNLLQDLQEQFGIAYLFIAHDLAVVEHISDHVLVMHHGKIVESASAEAIYNDPQNDYTKTLLAAVPSLA